jgi:hypothetical protein
MLEFFRLLFLITFLSPEIATFIIIIIIIIIIINVIEQKW